MTTILANMGIFRPIYEVLKENITTNGPITGENWTEPGASREEMASNKET
jgi:hypothetical protein